MIEFRRLAFAIGSALAMLTASMAFPVSQLAAAQSATPDAAAATGAVPCTNLFGIALGNACVLTLHGAAQVGPVDIYVDGELVLQAAEFGILNDFLPVPAGERQVQIVGSGDAPDNAVLDAVVELGDGIAYEVAALGAADDIRVQLLPVETTPLPTDAARVRVIHASPDAPPIDVAITGGEILIEALETDEISAYVEIPAGVYDLEARVAGTADVALPLPGTELAPNTVYSVYVTGLVAEGSLGATLVPLLVSPDIAGAAATPVP